jgi:NADPH:quinone reductase-like Zn-dependent oxidoreductase
MKALVFRRYGKRDNITFADVPRPLPKPDEIIVQVHAVGLNPIDTMVPKGSFKPMLKFQLPATLGSDLAGVVVETGSRVTRFKPGDAVFASDGRGISGGGATCITAWSAAACTTIRSMPISPRLPAARPPRRHGHPSESCQRKTRARPCVARRKPSLR